MGTTAPHRIEHDRWMTHPDDQDYLAPADRWCRVCARPDREHVCTTCGHRADDPYRNEAAGEGCVDRIHDAFVDRRTGETYYGFSSKAAYDAVQRDKAASPWIRGQV